MYINVCMYLRARPLGLALAQTRARSSYSHRCGHHPGAGNGSWAPGSSWRLRRPAEPGTFCIHVCGVFVYVSSTHKHYKTDTKKRVGTEQGKSELRNKETDRFHRLARAAAWHLLSRQAPKQMHQTRHEVPRSRRWTEIVWEIVLWPPRTCRRILRGPSISRIVNSQDGTRIFSLISSTNE